MRKALLLALLAVLPEGASAQDVVVQLPGSNPSPSPTPAAPATLSAAGEVPAKANPYGRAIDLTVNIQFFKKDLGETILHLDKAGGVSFDAQPFSSAIKLVLNEAGQVKLDAAIAGRNVIRPEDLSTIGIVAAFDTENVALTIASIDPSLRKLVSIYHEGNNDAEKEVNASPSGFSFFADASVSESRLWSGPGAGFRHPSFFINSAMRVAGFVLEGSGQFADRNPSSASKDFRFDRNFVRLVYDRPTMFLRSYFGDLTPEVRFQQNFVPMGGLGISRQKRRFDAFRTAVLQGNRQLILQRESTVDVYRNGALFQQLQLAPGAYDLSNLPLLSGSNDIRLSVRDESGVAQTVNYQTYLDPIDLEPGDFEYGGYVGKMSTRFGLSPKYDGGMAFSGFYRKAFLHHPAIGVGVQASRSVQQVSGQTQFLVGSGLLDMTGAVSRSTSGTGYFAGLSYNLALDQSERSTSASFQGTFQSRLFTGLGAPLQVNATIANASVILTHGFSPRLSAQGGATFIHNRKPTNDGYRIFADGYYQLSRKWFVRGGIDYQRLSQSSLSSLSRRQGGFGFNAALVLRISPSDRAEARYDSHFDNAQLSYDHSPDGYVGSLGYGALLSRSKNQMAAQGFAAYTANRFSGSVSHSLAGTSIGQITNRQVTTARLSTAIAFADGALAITRRVGDSFAILTPHRSLKKHQVILGQLLTDSRYRSRSGALGGAVNGSLSSYVTQSIQYDVEDPPAGYDVGLGVYRVRPPYHSGYHLVVGTDAFVTATGTLIDDSGKPVSLTSGEVLDLSKADAAAASFFTNSAGRFAVPSLRLNNRYRVRLSSGQAFEFTVPADSEGLIDLHSVTVKAVR